MLRGLLRTDTIPQTNLKQSMLLDIRADVLVGRKAYVQGACPEKNTGLAAYE